MPERNLFGWSDAVWRLLDQAGILAGDLLMVTSVVAAIAGWLKRDQIRRWFRRNAFPDVGDELLPGDADWDGLVFTVSREDVPRWVMNQSHPRAVAFVCSELSHGVANALAEHAKAIGIRSLLVRTVEPDDPAEARSAAAASIEALREAGCERLAVDVTGGKLPMSLGAFMAAEERGADTVYVSAEYDSGLKAPKMETTRVLRISRGRG